MKKYLENLVGKLNQDAWELLSKISEEQIIGKGTFLLEEGQVCRNLWFLEQGAIKAYEIRDGEFQNTHFFTDQCFLTNYMSVLTKQPSDLFFKVVENSKLIKIPYDKLECLYQENHQIEHIGRLMGELQFISEFKLRRLLLNMNALERYEHLEKYQPEVFVKFSLKDIASFLGITSVSLSRLRKYRLRKR